MGQAGAPLRAQAPFLFDTPHAGNPRTPGSWSHLQGPTPSPFLESDLQEVQTSWAGLNTPGPRDWRGRGDWGVGWTCGLAMGRDHVQEGWAGLRCPGLEGHCVPFRSRKQQGDGWHHECCASLVTADGETGGHAWDKTRIHPLRYLLELWAQHGRGLHCTDSSSGVLWVLQGPHDCGYRLTHSLQTRKLPQSHRWAS